MMGPMKGKVGLENLQIDCIIGDLEAERAQEQKLLLSLSWELAFDRVARSDALSDTVDYTAVKELCRKIASEGKYRMIEALAAALFKGLTEQFHFPWLEVKVYKPSVGAFAQLEGRWPQ